VRTAPGLLRRLYAESLAELQARRARVPASVLEARVRERPSTLDLAPALRGVELKVVAEMKRRTPSMGLLAADYRPAELAAAYAEAGAAAISVLCQEQSFGGSPDDLVLARSAAPGVPILRKDFVLDEYQILEARGLGADAVLLICAGLEPSRLGELLRYAWGLDLEALVEVHDAAEATLALELGARVVGVNHRDLDTFEVDVSLSEELRPLFPPEVVFVAESGIQGRAVAERMRRAGADAVLVGEALMRSADPGSVIRELSC